MKKSFLSFVMKNKNLFAIAFVFGLAMPWLSGGGSLLQGSLLTASNYSKMSLEDSIVAYHVVTNEEVNKFLEALVEAEEPSVNYVASDTDCDSGNLSTYCLAVALNENLVAFEQSMAGRADEIDDEIKELGSSITIEDAIEKNALKNELVGRQVEVAEDTLDLTLAVYNQVQIVLPVHTELVNLIANLEEYRGNLAKIRNTIELYPSKFNDATTTTCK